MTAVRQGILASHEEQGDPRLVAQAISEGFNVCHALADAGSITTPDPEWGSALDSFANALEAVQQGRVRTDMQVGLEDVDRARQLAALVKRWHDTGERDEQLAKLAFTLSGATVS